MRVERSIVYVALLLSLPVVAAAQGRPAPASNQAFLYEMSENAVLVGFPFICDQSGCTVDPRGGLVVLMPDPTGQSPTKLVVAGTNTPGFPTRRQATSELQGVAALGSLLCPSEVLVTVPKGDLCTVTATGMSDVPLDPDPRTGALVPGAGTLSGTYAVVIQLDNPIDSPELPVQTGTFSGTISFRPPLGFATATATIDGVKDTKGNPIPFEFSATFRQPFAMSAHGERMKPRRGRDAFYLGDTGHLIPVRQDERAVGWPTVRFEINFP